ncbi:MAG: putative tricarboxylic transport rane protein [Clostridia bacterium]|nr:putative tricarboxylic transport rane protein [Clostridia bacterium]MDN5324265.1 putative tricarboxylic transport rane protein [Clostridia bacterium]
MTMRKFNYILSILILALCFFFWIDAAGIRPPAHIYPKTVIAITAFLAVALLVQSIFFPKALIQGKPFEGTKYGRVLTTLLSTIVYFFAVKTIGFYVSSFFFLVIVTWILGDKSEGVKALARLGILGIVVVGLVYASFKLFLKVPTPPGILF